MVYTKNVELQSVKQVDKGTSNKALTINKKKYLFRQSSLGTSFGHLVPFVREDWTTGL